MPIQIDIISNDQGVIDSFERVKRSVAEMSAYVGKFDSGAGDAFSTMRMHAEAAAQSTSKLSQAFGSFFQQYTAANIALRGFMKVKQAIGDAADTIADFQSQQSLLGAILGESAEGIKEMTEQAKDLGRTTVFTASQVSQLQIELSKLGFERKPIQDMTESILAFAQATGGDLGDAAALTGAAIRMFGAQTEEASRYTNAMARATTASALNFQVIRDNLATFGPMAHSLGLEIEDVLALFGTLKNAGVEGSTAMTSLRNIFTKVAQGKVPGMEGGIKTLDEFISKLKAINDMSPGDAMKKIGTRGGTQFMTLIQQADQILELRDKIKMASEQDTTAGMAEQMTNNVNGAIKMMQSAWEGFVLSFSESTGPWKDVIDLITKGITGLTNVIATGSTISKDALYTLMTGLGSLITMYGVKNGVVAVTNRLTAAQTLRYTQMAAALEAANHAEATGYNIKLQSAVANGVITKELAAKITVLMRESEAQMARMVAERDAIITERQAIAVEMEYAKAQLASAAATDKNFWAQQQKNLVEKDGILTTRLATANTNIDTLAHERDAAAKMLNAGATGKLRQAMDLLGLSMLKNPIVLATAAIVGLSYAIYSARENMMTAEKAQKTLNYAAKEHNQQLEQAVSEERGYLSTIQDKNASLYDQYKAYKDLTAESKVFAQYSQEALRNMSQSEIDSLFSEAKTRKAQEMIQNRVKALQEYKEWLDKVGGSAAWATAGEEAKLREIGQKYGLGEETAKWFESAGWNTNWNQWVKEMQSQAGAQLQEYLEDVAYSGLSEGLKRGFADKDVEHQVSTLLDGLAKDADKMTPQLADSYKKQVEPVVDGLREHIADIKRELSDATGDKKVKLTTELEAANADMQMLTSLLALIDAGVDNKEIIIKIQQMKEDSMLGEDTILDIADLYEKSDEIGKKYAMLFEQAEEKAHQTGAATKEELDAIAEELGITAESVEGDFGEMEGTLRKDLENLFTKLKDAKTDAERDKIKLEIDKKQELLDYISGLKSSLLGLVSQKYTIFLELAGQAWDTLRGWLGLGASKPKSTPMVASKGGANWGGMGSIAEGWLNSSYKAGESNRANLNNMVTRAATIRSQRADAKASEVKAAEEEAKGGKGGKKGKGGKDKAKEEANRRAREIADALKHAEELRKAEQEGADALEEARIARIVNDAERERAEREHQHNMTVDKLKEQQNAIYKTIYEERKRAYENANKDKKYENTELGALGWGVGKDGKNVMSGTLTADEQKEFDTRYAKYKAELDKEAAEYARYLEKNKQAEQNAMETYLREFGTAQEKRMAIAQGYDERISRAQTAGERNTLVAQREQALQAHDMEQQRKDMDMESLFNNLGQMSLDKLTQAKEELRGMLSDENLGMDDYKTIAEQIDKVEDAIVDKQKQKKGLIGQLIPGETTVQRLKRQQAEAEEQVKAATEKVVELQQQLAGQKLGIFSLLSMGGANYTGDISAANRSAIMESARNAGFSKEKLEELEKAMDGLVVTTGNLNNAEENEEEAKKKVSEKQMLLGEAVGDLQQKVSDFAASLETINANIQALPALMDSLGLGNTGAGQAISSVASAANNAMGAMADFSSGNYVGAAVKAVGAVKDVAGAFSPDNTAKMQKKIDELNSHSDALAMAMKSLQKAFEKSYGIDAMRNAEKQRQLLESQQRDAQMAMVYEARKHGAGRSTLNASVNDNYDWQVAMAMVSQILGKNVRYSGDDFLQLSAAEMQKIIDYDNGELWNKILAEYRKEGGNGGRSDQLPDMLQSYVDNFADAFDELDEVLNERLTTTTLDNVFGDYKNYLYDLANGSEDVFDNIEKNWQAMINQMVVDNLIFGKVQDQLKQWYEDLASLQRDKNEGNISPEEYARRLDALKNTYTDIMKGSQQEIEDFKEWGIIKPIEEAVEEAKTAFGSLRDTFKDSLLDMESDAETFKKNLQRTLYEDLIEKNVFDVPFTINGMTFDDFDAYSKDWNERYAKAVADGDTAALEALIDELVQAREITAQAAETYREALKSLEETVSDTTFKDMGGSWVNMLMGMDSDAETWGKEIGRTMAQKIIEQMILADTMQPLLDTLQDEFNRAMADGSSWEAVLADEGVNAALAEIEKAYPELQETVTAIMDRLGLKVEEQAKQGFSDLRSLMTSALLDTEGDMETFGKSMAETMMKQMLDAMIDSKYKERMNAISAEWADALEAADPARIDAVKQQVMDLYKEIGDDSEIKQLTADIKALAEVTEDTSTPFDNLRSSYHSAIMDMTKTTEDFAKDINKMIADAFVDEFVMGKAFDDKLAEWKQAYANITKNGDLNEEQKVKQLKALGNLIAAEGEEMKEQTKNILGWLGLSNNVEDQGATMNMAEAATYDQFELYLGIATAQQINGEQQLSVQQQILSTLQSMSGITSPNGETVKEISSRMRTANEYLLSIRDSNKAILDTMTRKLDVINSNLTRIL